MDKDGWVCESCGHLNSYWYSNTCDHCGKRYSNEQHVWKCNECGTTNRLTNYYCDNCNHRIRIFAVALA